MKIRKGIRLTLMIIGFVLIIQVLITVITALVKS